MIPDPTPKEFIVRLHSSTAYIYQGSNYRFALRKLRGKFLLLRQKCFTQHEKCKAVFSF